MKIGIDVNSGERPFQELVEGVLQSSQKYKKSVFYIIGNSLQIKQVFPRIIDVVNIVLIDALEVIGMEEQPIPAVKKKKKSSVVVGVTLLKNGTIDLFFSPGNTGATVVASAFGLGMLPGFKKPTMGSFLPRMVKGETLILDVGANPEAREDCFYQNAVIGSSFYRILFQQDEVSFGLLNMGTEYSKGNNFMKKVYQSLSGIKGFVGNVEPYHIIDGSVDVVVCDGFTGNTVIKVSESLKKLFTAKFESYIKKSNGHSFLRRILVNEMLKSVFNSSGSEKKSGFMNQLLPRFYGAAVLLGVNGMVLIGHGMCSKNDLLNAIDFAEYLEDKRLFPLLLKEWRKNNKFSLNFFSKEV